MAGSTPHHSKRGVAGGNRAAGAAGAIWSAWSSGDLMTSLPEEVRPATVADGLEVQRALEELAGPVAGWKLAATSRAGQRHIGVEEPVVGRLFERFVFEDAAVLPAGRMNMAIVEAEFAFRLGVDLPDGGTYTRAQVLEAIDTLHPAIEVPESRFARFDRVGPAQLTADDACGGRFVLGDPVDRWRRHDLAKQEVRIEIGGRTVAVGSGANVLTGPIDALLWIANTDKGGAALLAGQVITTGTTTVPAPIQRDSAVRADFGALGTVSVRFRADGPVA